MMVLQDSEAYSITSLFGKEECNQKRSLVVV